MMGLAGIACILTGVVLVMATVVRLLGGIDLLVVKPNIGTDLLMLTVGLIAVHLQNGKDKKP